MSAPGSNKTDATGRSIGARKTNRRTRIEGQFAPRTIEMLRSPAWRVLSLSARRILDRLEIELADHGGADNGKLPVTFNDFEQYGIHRHAIAPGAREVTALGFAELTRQGRAGNGEWRAPHLWRVTYRNTQFDGPTNEWRRIATIEEAEAKARAARKPVRRPAKNKTPVADSASHQCRKPHPKNDSPVVDSDTTGPSADSATTV